MVQDVILYRQNKISRKKFNNIIKKLYQTTRTRND